MMEQIKVPMEIRDVGVALAHDSDNNQSALINEFSKELFVACKGERGFETQCCYMSDKLNSSGIRLIKMLAEFIELRESGDK